MKFDYLLRSQAKYRGDYTIYLSRCEYLDVPFLRLGTWKLTKEGREKFKHLLEIEVERQENTWGNTVLFKIDNDEIASELVELLWLAHGIGAIDRYERYIERINP